MTNLEYLMILNSIPDIGFVRMNNLINRFGGIKEIFEADQAELEEAEKIGPKVASAIIECDKDETLDGEMKLIDRYGVKVVSCFDEGYPANLKEIYNPPIVLYMKGELTAEDKYSIAIVGSRRASRYGLQTAERLGCELASRGLTVVSGLARGIDACGHKGALKAKGRTIAVLGSGLANIYPPEHIKLAEEIAKDGAAISEFPMNMEPYKDNFPRRNRIISGLCLGVIVVEAARNSGALITADFALEEGRELFAVPGQARAATSAGTNMLIRQGAKLVESADDVIEELDEVIKGHMKATAKMALGAGKISKIPGGLNESEAKILAVLKNAPISVDEITEETGLPPAETMNCLTRLELKSFIKRLPGKFYARNN